MSARAGHPTVLTGDSMLDLIARMSADLAAAPIPPFDEEIVVVQSQGMARWVRQELAKRQGCAASLQCPFPAAFVHRLARTLHGAQHHADGPHGLPLPALDERFSESALTWRVFTMLGDAGIMADAAMAPLHAYLRPHEPRAEGRRRFTLAQRIASRFDDYQLYRPDIIHRWEGAAPGGAGDVGVSAHERWQAYLWRLLTDGRAPMHTARWLATTMALLEQRATDVQRDGLPQRVSVFGIATLPPTFIRLLTALSRTVPVRYYVLSAEPSTWTPPVAANPLVRALGDASRELLTLLTADGASVEHLGTAADGEPRTMLSCIQHDIRRGVTRGAVAAPPSVTALVRDAVTPHAARAPMAVDADDRSLTVHVCHSPTREMEVLRDQLLDAFVADPTLRPHDVLVLVPDVRMYGPIASAILGSEQGDIRAIPHRIADRTLAQQAAPARALLQLLDLVTSRRTASEVINLLQVESVRRAAGITATDMEQVSRWIELARIRWGWDGASRQAQFDLPAVDDNGWREGIERLLLGYAVGPDDALYDGVVPVAGDTIGDAELLGRFVHWVDQLFATLAELGTPRTASAWTAVLQDALTWLLDAPDAEANDIAAVERMRRTVRALDTLPLPPDRELPFEALGAWLRTAIDADEQAGGFRAGGLTVAAIKPMRSIPFRIIAMLGLDDSAFPRRDRRAAFDLLELEHRAGDRDIRRDDRQLFLDTLLCAQDRLILSYTGRSQADNSEIAPSVMISELLEVVDRSFVPADAGTVGSGHPSVRERVVVEHRLQPFSVAYFDGSDPRLFSFDHALAASVDASRRRDDPAPFLVERAPQPAVVHDVLHLTVQSLVDCWTNPARFYCQHALSLRIPSHEDGAEDIEPLVVGPLQRNHAHTLMLSRHLRGRHDLEAEHRLFEALGDLPPAALAAAWHGQLRREIAPFLEGVGMPAFDAPLAVDLAGADWRLTGRLENIVSGGRLQIRAATCKSKDVVTAWIRHVVLQHVKPESTTTLLATDARTVFSPLDRTLAAAHLEFLLRGYRRALSEPLPFFLAASREYQLTAASDADKALGKAARKFAEAPAAGGDQDAHVALVWRGRSPTDAEHAEDFAALATGFWNPVDANIDVQSTDAAGVA